MPQTPAYPLDVGRGAGDNEKTANAMTRSGAASAPPTYTPDFELQPGDQLVASFPERVSSTTGETIPAQEYAMTVADPAYDEKDRVVIVEETHGRVLGNRNASPAVRRYKRNSKKLVGREVRRENDAPAEEPVVTDAKGREITVGSIAMDMSAPSRRYGPPRVQVFEIGEPKDDMVIVKIGPEGATRWSSMLLGLVEPDGRYRTSLQLFDRLSL